MWTDQLEGSREKASGLTKRLADRQRWIGEKAEVAVDESQWSGSILGQKTAQWKERCKSAEDPESLTSAI